MKFPHMNLCHKVMGAMNNKSSGLQVSNSANPFIE